MSRGRWAALLGLGGLLAGCATVAPAAAGSPGAAAHGTPAAAATRAGPGAPAAASARAAAAAPASAPPRPPAPVARLRLPAGAFTGLGEGLVRTVPVSVENRGKAPFVLLDLVARGAGEGHRRLTIPAGAGRIQAFGFVPPGASARYHLGVYFPTPGAGVLRLVARLRPLAPGTAGRLMEPVRISATGPTVTVTRRIRVRVAPRTFSRAAAEARIGGQAAAAVYVRFLHAWVLRRGNGTFVVTVSDTISFPGLSLAAAALLDEYDHAVPVLDAEGRLHNVPKGPALRLVLDRARRDGQSVTVTTYADGRQALRVGR